jgi:DNA topoisomerase IA
MVVEAKVARVSSITGSEASRWKPVPLNSVDFAMLASKSLHMPSDHAAKLAEELYMEGLISYPRTETREF